MINQVISFINANKALTASMKVPWALVMDTCAMTRNGLSSVLKKTQYKTGEVMMLDKASDIPLCLELDSPDIVVMELCGDGESVLEGLSIISSCRQYWPRIPIVVCTTLSDVRFLQQVKSLQVSSVCHKYDPLEAIEECIMLARSGINQDSPTVQRLLNAKPHIASTLTRKEIDVLVYLFKGCSVSDVSRMLNRDIRTISSHKCNAMTKLGYKNNGDLYTRGQWMLINGLYNLDDAKQV
ncbi:TPA: LuxR C-terminal-related transcriptional regulator [Serratia fonticola]